MHGEMLKLLLSVIFLSSHVCTEKLLTLKCCPFSMELLPTLRSCTKSHNMNQSSITGEQSTNIDYITNSNITSANEVEAIVTVNGSSANPVWLPETLQRLYKKRLLGLVVGRPNNCNRTLRIKMHGNNYDTLMHDNGTFELRSPTVFNDSLSLFFSPGEYCVDAYTDEDRQVQLAVLLCACDRVKCVNKCCPFGQVMWCESNICDCKQFEANWRPIHPQLPLPLEDFPYTIIDDEVPTCKEGFQPYMDLSTIYPKYLLRNFWEYPRGKVFNEEDICADTQIRSGVVRQEMIRCGSVLPYWARLSISYWLHAPEVLLLALTIITILIVPRTRMSTYSYAHDYAMACHATSLLIRGVIWTIFTKSRMSEELCTYPPIVVYFSSLAAALWLNVICINMTCGFWKPLGLQNGRLRGARRMFLCYSLYAWGISLGMTAFATAMWFVDEVPGDIIRPTFHETRTCFREEDGKGKMATFAYFFGPLLLLLFVNAILFLSTASRVMLLRKNTKILGNKISTGRETSPHNQRSVMVYIKLVWLMGLLEVAVEVAAWASNSNEYYFTTAASCIDVLRAVAIFVLHCCKRRTLRALRHRLLSACGVAAPTGAKNPRAASISLSTVTDASVSVVVSADATAAAPRRRSSDHRVVSTDARVE